MNIVDIKNNKIEEIIELRTILEKEVDNEQLESILTKLENYNITYDDLKVTKVGHSLKKLTKHKSEVISKRAETLMNKWKKLLNTNGSTTSGTSKPPIQKGKLVLILS
jgi:hypothetical protein